MIKLLEGQEEETTYHTIENKIDELMASLHVIHHKLYGPQITDEKEERIVRLPERLAQKMGECSDLVMQIGESINKIG